MLNLSKIGQLPTAGALTGDEEFPLNQAGDTKKAKIIQVINYSGYPDHAANAAIHRQINDAGSANTDLWSADKITTMLGGKANLSHQHSAADITSGVLAFLRGGLGFGAIAQYQFVYADGTNQLAPGDFDSNQFGFSGNTLQITPDATRQLIHILEGGSGGGTQPTINFIGDGVVIDVVNDSGGNKVDVTIGPAVASTLSIGYQDSSPPVYLTASTFSVAKIIARNSDNTGDIVKATSTTVDISTTGLNGCAQSGANLSGTIDVTSGSATVTGTGTLFQSDFAVNQYILTAGGQSRQILAIPSDTTMTVTSNFSTTETGVTYKKDLVGTISVSSGNATITGSGTSFTTDFIIGEVFVTAGGQARRITAVGSDTSMTAASTFSSNESTVSYKRGGEAISTWYHPYLTTNGTTTGILLSTRSIQAGETLVDIPSGYTSICQLPVPVYNDSSGNLLPWVVYSGWPNSPEIKFRDSDENTLPYVAVSNGTPGNTFTDVTFLAPKGTIAVIVSLRVGSTFNATATDYFMRSKGSSNTVGDYLVTFTSQAAGSNTHKALVDSTRTAQYRGNNALNGINITTLGFVMQK